ncbi:DHA2 family efflux MFS transporter permease subunit [Aquirhabdus sp.]|uniref:DHA2 family efflux MFS transporter permease subunit n=1 Tax=Aquirhabdus sp. TaxID=2824160 RepID=UPI00396C9151
MSISPALSKNRVIITIAVMLATIMQALDTTIANVALPRMQGTLSATQDQMTWVLTSYIVAAAITIPLTGWLANRYDRRLIFLISIAGFTLASALCGLAENLPQIVLFRLLQGISGAALVPLSQAILFDINPPERHGSAMATWGVGVTMGPILGPALGGWLTENYNWRWVFYINVPIGILAFLGLLFFLPKRPGNPLSRFDFLGFISLSLAIGALQLFLDRGELKGWFSSPEIVIEALVAGIGLYIFVVHMFSHKSPFLNPALFKDRNFLTSNVFIFVVGVVLFATLALIPPMLQGLMNYPVVTTGLVTAPRGIGTMLAMMIVGRLVGRIEVRVLIAFGLVLTIISLWQMTQFSLLMNEWPMIISGVLQGFGVGLVYVPLSTVAFATLPPHLRTEGTAFFNLMRNLGSSVGISMVQILLTRNTQILHASLAEHITPFNPAAQPALQAAKIDLASPQSLAILNNEITRQAAMIAYLNDFKLIMIMAIVLLPLLVFIQKARQKPSNEHPVVME